MLNSVKELNKFMTNGDCYAVIKIGGGNMEHYHCQSYREARNLAENKLKTAPGNTYNIYKYVDGEKIFVEKVCKYVHRT